MRTGNFTDGVVCIKKTTKFPNDQRPITSSEITKNSKHRNRDNHTTLPTTTKTMPSTTLNTTPKPTSAPHLVPVSPQCTKAAQPPQNLPQEFRVRLTKPPLALVSATASKNAPTENHLTMESPAPPPCWPRSIKTMGTKTLASTAAAANIGVVNVPDTEGVTKITEASKAPASNTGNVGPTKNHPTTGRPAPPPCWPRSVKTMDQETLAPAATASKKSLVVFRETDGATKTHAAHACQQQAGENKSMLLPSSDATFPISATHGTHPTRALPKKANTLPLTQGPRPQTVSSTKNAIVRARTITNALAGLDKMTSIKKATRRGKTGTGGRRSCSSMVLFFSAAMLLIVDVVCAVFTPPNDAAFATAKSACLSETTNGSCPVFAASNVPGTGNPYGVIGDWDVSSVTSMYQSKCSPSHSPSLRGHTATRVSSV